MTACEGCGAEASHIVDFLDTSFRVCLPCARISHSGRVRPLDLAGAS